MLSILPISNTARWNCHDGTNRGSRFLCIRQQLRPPAGPIFARLRPTPVAAPRLVRLNKKLAWHLELDPGKLAAPEGVEILAGNRVPKRGEPLATAYAGHQLGLSYLNSVTDVPFFSAR